MSQTRANVKERTMSTLSETPQHCDHSVSTDVAMLSVEKPPQTVIEPPHGWELINVRELWGYRELLFFLCWRDVKVRYKQTVLGAAWAILQPAMMMAVFTIFFSRLAGLSSGDTPYPLFALAGVLPWFFF